MMLSSGHNGKAGFYRSARHRASSDDAGRRPRRSRQSLGGEGFVVTDADGPVRYPDPLAEALLHGRADKLVGQPFGYRTLDRGSLRNRTAPTERCSAPKCRRWARIGKGKRPT